MADFVQTVRLPFCCQEPSGGGRTHLEEESSRLIIDMERSMFREVLQGEWHASYHRRTESRNVLALQIVIMPSGLPGHTGKDGAGVYASWDQSPQDALSQEGALSCLMQGTGDMPPAIPRRLTEVVQHHRPICLPCLPLLFSRSKNL